MTKSTYDSDSVLSTATAASDKVLVPGSESDSSSALAGQSGTSGAVSEDPQVSDNSVIGFTEILTALDATLAEI